MQKGLVQLNNNNIDAVAKAKNEANVTINKLNQQIVLERATMIAKQQEKSRTLESDYRVKEDQLNVYVIEAEEREQAWQNEKADVLREVQRLKSEATRMVKILAMEYAEENIPNKANKRSLSQEVYSLQLVVEMRTGEVRNLREQLARATQQLEQGELGKERLKKTTARMEDLEEQLKIKNDFER